MKGLWKFVYLFAGMVAVGFGFAPVGAAGLIAGRMFYGSWEAGFTFYEAQLAMAAVSIVGVIPIYGNKLHYEIARDYIIPWAATNGLNPTWLLSLWGFFSGVLASMCPGSLVFQVEGVRTGSTSMPNWVLAFAAIALLCGSIFSAVLFFGDGN